MNILNLPENTLLIFDSYLTSPDSEKRFYYPCYTGKNYTGKKSNPNLVMIHFFSPNNTNCQFMGPEEKKLRFPTQEDLDFFNLSN